MTKEEMLKLKVGPELNALVAEQIINLTVNRSNNSFAVVRDGNRHGLKSYSSDYAAAFEVVEKMSQNEMPMTMDNNHYLGHFDCGFYTDDITLIQVEAQTAPEAICKAALLAVMDS